VGETTGELLDRFCAGDDPEHLRRDAAELLVANFASYGIELLDGEDAERLQAAWDENGEPTEVVRTLPIRRVVPPHPRDARLLPDPQGDRPARIHRAARRHL
jgi:hypothetical protein